MNATICKDEPIEALVNSGLRNLWYPVAASWSVKTAPLGVTRLGERLAIWRDGRGQIHAISDRCPHRGARLSLGWNIGDRLACWYHGVEVDGKGVMASVPAISNCPLEGRKLNRVYPAKEIAGAIFVWFGEEGSQPAPLEVPDEIQGGEWAEILCTAHWNCNYRYALENVIDPMHGAYLHAVSHSMAEGAKTAVMRSRNTSTGFIFEKADQAGVNFDWTEFGQTGFQWMRLEIPYRKTAGPGGSFRIIGAVVPVTETSCRVFFWRCRKVDGWQRNAWRFLYRARLEGLHWDVLEQDRLILEGMMDDARNHEGLYAHDAGLVRLRRHLRQMAESEIKAKLVSEAAGVAE